MITVILCSRNGASYIRSQLDSILQNKVCDFRVLVFDDRSQDGTLDILDEYEEKYPGRIDYIERRRPTGSSTANFLMAIAEAPDTDYYMLSDQDDIWHSDKMVKLLASISARESIDGKSTPILVHSDAVVVRDSSVSGDQITTKKIADSFVDYEGLSPERTKFNQLLFQNQVTGGACIFNHALKELVEEITDEDLAYPDKAWVHDHWLAILCAAFGKIYYFNEALYDYRQHSSNQIGAKKASFIGETMKRLGFGDLNKSEMDLITRGEFLHAYAQARQFKELYGAKLDPKKKKALDAFCKLDYRKKPGKVFVILRYGFTFNKFYRTVGEILFI